MISDDNSTYKMSIKFNNTKVEIDCKAKKDKNCKEIGENNYLNQGEEFGLKHEINTKNAKYDEELINNVTLKHKELCGKKLLGQKSFFN